MSFLAQRESYLTANDAIVSEVVLNQVVDPTNPDKAAIRLNDSVLFPEGGGQPGDTGFINDVNVINSVRDGTLCYHIIDTEKIEQFKTGDSVKVVLDWSRRYDIMKHHTGQHLLSAIMMTSCGFNTVSWKLTDTSLCWIDIDVDSTALTVAHLEEIENLARLYIQNKCVVKIIEVDENQVEEHGIRTRGLPADVAYPLRCSSINAPIPPKYVAGKLTKKEELNFESTDSVDVSLCCGTHLSNLSEVESIVIGREFHRVKKGVSRIFFAAGERVQDVASFLLDVSAQMKPSLCASMGVAQVNAANELKKNYECTLKDIKLLQTDLVDTASELYLITSAQQDSLTRTYYFPSFTKAMSVKFAHNCGLMDPLKTAGSIPVEDRLLKGVRSLIVGGKDNSLFFTGISDNDTKLLDWMKEQAPQGKGSIMDNYSGSLILPELKKHEKLMKSFEETFGTRAGDNDIDIECFTSLDESLQLGMPQFCQKLESVLIQNVQFDFHSLLKHPRISEESQKAMRRILTHSKDALKGFKPQKQTKCKPFILPPKTTT